MNPLRMQKRVTKNSEFVIGADTRSGSYTTDPVDISAGRGWSVQFAMNGTGTVQTQVSSGDTSAWANLGSTYTVENGTMISDDLAPYKYIRFQVTADPGVSGSAILTMVI